MSFSGWEDFITSYQLLVEDAVSPSRFKLWAAISLVAGALERRVFIKTSDWRPIYPNFYIVLVAPPGVGKYVINHARDLWKETLEPGTSAPAFHVASDSLTNASLIDELARAACTRIIPVGPMLQYHSLLVASEELQVLLPAYDQSIIGKLNSLWNSGGDYSETRRTGPVKEVKIDKPCLNILAGAQPGYFASTFPEEAWNTGLARRLFMVYATETPHQSLWKPTKNLDPLRRKILSQLAVMSSLCGAMKWTPEAAEHIDKWHMAGEPGHGGPPIPRHSKLAQYCRSRTVNAIKLAGISAISRTSNLVIELCDVERGIDWMLEAESMMPDIFRAMIGKSDIQVIEETHLYVTGLYSKAKINGHGGREPIPGEVIRRFLIGRVPHDKTETILVAMERANILARVAGTADLFIPKPKHEHFGEE